MRKFIVLGIAVAMTGAAVTQAAVKSGLDEGARVPAFNVMDVTGPSKGKKLCYRCKYGARPVVSIFARDVNEELGKLIKQTDAFVGKNKDSKAAAFVVLLTDDPDAAEGKLKALAKKHDIKNVPLTIFDGKAGPGNYKIAKDAEVTVMMWNESKVRSNHAFKKGELNKKATAKVVKSTAKLIK
ncbi:hypothetical protein OAH18_02970 [bacterium]|nr:hypothetical protein [bacterium]